MTIHTKEVQVTEIHTVAVQCNKCKKKYTPDDIIEWQEFLIIRRTGGYSSVFGDGCVYRIDLCQSCMFNLLSKYVEYIDE